MKSLDIKIVTCHDVYNFGASLQAYAMQTYLESLGHQVKVVDYKPYYQPSDKVRLLEIPHGRHWFRELCRMLYHLPMKRSHRVRNRVFDRFTTSCLHLTERYHDIQQLIASHIDADVFIAGSDQIWNGYYLTGRDSVFYLDFVKSSARKVAYAPSISSTQMDKCLEYFYLKKLPCFDFVSVREKSSVPFMHRMGREDTEVVCDPVLLLSAEEWGSLVPFRRLVDGGYVLVYDFDNNKQISAIAKAIAKEEGLKIINISIDTLGGLGTKLKDIGPEEFLSLVKGASFVVSSSYHATLFSMLFHKRFCIVRRQLNINLRLEDLADDYGFSDRIVSEFSPSLLDDIDYSQVDGKMAAFVSSSKDFLARALHFD